MNNNEVALDNPVEGNAFKDILIANNLGDFDRLFLTMGQLVRSKSGCAWAWLGMGLCVAGVAVSAAGGITMPAAVIASAGIHYSAVDIIRNC